MPEQLKVKIGADVNEGVNGIKRFGAAVNTLPSSMGKVDSAVKKTSTNFTGLSRVIQDLPFGFIGIQNNLTQLLPAAGALGLGISALTAAFTFASVGLANWSGLFPSANDKIKDQIKAIKDYAQSLDDYVDTLDDVSRARVRGEQDAQKELGSLKTLYEATQNLNIPIAKRRELVDELQKQYPAYFGNIKDEIILTGGAENAYKKLTIAILAASKARAAQKELDTIEEQRRVIDQQQIASLQKQSDLYQKLREIRSRPVKAAEAKISDDPAAQAGKLITALVEIGTTVGESDAAQQEYNKALAEYNNLQKQNISLTDRAIAISKELTATVEGNPDALLDPGRGLNKGLKKKQDEIKARPFLLPMEPVLGNIPKVNEQIRKQFEGHPALLPVEPDFRKDAFLLDVVDSISEVRKAGAKLSSEMGDAFSELFQTRVQGAIAKGMSVEQLEKFQEGLRATLVIGAQVADVLGNAFGAFGQALVQGQNALQAFFNSVKNALSQLIGQLLKTIATAAILSAITGGAGAAGGFSFLSALKGLLSVKPFAKGGLAFGPTLGLVGEGRNINRSNPEVISPLSDLKKFLGGTSEPQGYIASTKIEWDGLAIAFQRMQQHRRRFQ